MQRRSVFYLNKKSIFSPVFRIQGKANRSYAVDDQIVVGVGLARRFSYDPDLTAKPAPTGA
jgi:hypothetical protein